MFDAIMAGAWLFMFGAWVYTGLAFVDMMLEGSVRGLLLFLLCTFCAAFSFYGFDKSLRRALNLKSEKNDNYYDKY